MLSILALLIATPVAAEQTPALDQKVERAAKKLMAAAKAAEGGDCRTGAQLAREVVDRRDAAALPEELLVAGLELAANCEGSIDRQADAYAHAFAATALTASSDQAWRLRLAYEIQESKHEAAVVTIEAMTQGRGAALASIPIRWIYQLDNNLKKPETKAARARLLSVLAGDGYLPDEPGQSTDGFKQRYAVMLHEQGRTNAATALVRQITYPSLLHDISLDPRFRAILPGDFDLRQIAEQALTRSRLLVEQHPDLIAPVNDTAMYLRQLGRPKESLDVLNALRPTIGDPSKYADASEHLVWWWDAVSRGHRMLGQYPEAVDALRKGVAALENGGLNVSQVINLSELQLAFGHPADALATLRAFEADKRDVAPYGTMQIVFGRACATAILGKPADAAADVAYAKAHAEDAPQTLTELLLCVGDVEGAAKSLIDRLDDPDDRITALADLSDYDEPPVAVPPYPGSAEWRLVKARPDVQAAIARAGGTRRFRVQRTGL